MSDTKKFLSCLKKPTTDQKENKEIKRNHRKDRTQPCVKSEVYKVTDSLQYGGKAATAAILCAVIHKLKKISTILCPI